MDFIQPDMVVVVVDFDEFEEREERRSWRMVGGRTIWTQTKISGQNAGIEQIR